MSEQGVPAITDADVRSLAAKLTGLSPLLTPAERVLLRTALGRAAGREEPAQGDVQGFAWRTTGNPFAQLGAIDFDTPVRRDRRTALRQRLGELQ